MIRPIAESDAEAISALAVRSELFAPEERDIVTGLISEYFRAKQSTGHRCVVDEIGGTPTGIAYYEPAVAADRTWYLTMIAVSLDRQRSGFGSALLSYVEDSLRTDDQRLLLVETSGTDGFDRARNFYRKNGYIEEARVRDFYALGDDMILFRKVL